MGLFDALKKKKAVKQDLETPPMPEAAQGPMQPAPGFEEYAPAPQPPQGASSQYPQFPPAQQFSQQSPSFGPQQPMNFPMPQQRAVPQPSTPSFAPEAQIPPIGMPPGADMSAQYGEVPEEMPMPMPSEEMAAPQAYPQMQQQQQSAQEQMPKVTLFGAQEAPQFKFYYGPERTEEAQTSAQEVPFDVTQELLHIPQMHQEEHPELHPEEEVEKPYKFIPQEAPEVKKEGPHISKQFITVAALYEVGEQLVNMGDDLALAKDTAFRLTDLNEQEIEQMAKWQALQQSMEMRIAEIDKLLFKA